MAQTVHKARPLTSRLIAAALAVAFLTGCERRESATPTAAPTAPAQAKAGTVELLLAYGSEKQNWLDDVTGGFNASGARVGDKIVHVTAQPMGSGESKDDILAGRLKAHLWSPASSVFVTLANSESEAKLGSGSTLVGPTKELVLSPVVIAMWKPMAEALGWPDKSVGWSDILALSKDPRGWTSRGRPEFGRFRFGHTHPEYSNSGLISILAEAYAGAAKVRGLSLADLQDPKVGQYVGEIEQSVVHYGRSTGFFGKTLYEDGPQYLSAAVLYENMVVESYQSKLSTPLVAIYPKEGTIWCDHPIAVVQRDWVGDEQKRAAELYIDYLRAAPQQQKALTYGFRPAQGDVAAPIDAEHGVDPREPKTILELPRADVIGAALDLWRAHKKHSNVVLVFDKSGSMKENDKIDAARKGARALVELLGADDTLGLVPFSTSVVRIEGVPLSSGRDRINQRIDALFPDGETHLYEAIQAGLNMVASQPRPGSKIDAVVVLTDGEDNGHRVTLNMLLRQIDTGAEGGGGVRIFTIGYGKSARLDDLKRIAKQAKGGFYQGTPENIRSVFRDIATFF